MEQIPKRLKLVEIEIGVLYVAEDIDKRSGGESIYLIRICEASSSGDLFFVCGSSLPVFSSDFLLSLGKRESGRSSLFDARSHLRED